MKTIPFKDWRYQAAKEIMETIRGQQQLQAYYNAGGGDGWSRQYGAPQLYAEGAAGIIDRHYQAASTRKKNKTTP